MQHSTTAPLSDSLADRMIGVAKLDQRVYEEIEHDQTATPQALTVVVLAAVASGIGAVASDGALGLLIAPIVAVLGWALFSAVAYYVGTKMLGSAETEATIPQLLRTLGFAQVPGMLAIFGILPILGALIGFAGAIWGLFAAIIALRVALEVSTGRAIAIGLISAILSGIIMLLLLLPFGLATLVFA